MLERKIVILTYCDALKVGYKVSKKETGIHSIPPLNSSTAARRVVVVDSVHEMALLHYHIFKSDRQIDRCTEVEV